MDEIRGLRLFADHFKDYQDQYVLIGGVASSITLENAGAGFRRTRDLDIVLLIEALTPAYVAHFWAFIKEGGYEIRQTGGGKPCFYRFAKPKNEAYPEQIELFSRSPEGMTHAEDAQITPIPADETVSSLSAILLDEDYYNFLRGGLEKTDGISHIGEDRLIPFKMKAWLDLSQRKGEGQQVDTKSINKHRNDVLRLSQLLTHDMYQVPESIRRDMQSFLDQVGAEKIDMKSLEVDLTMEEAIELIRGAFVVH